MKDDKHFHVCRAIGQAFTYDEYQEAISNLSPSTVIHSFRGFDFNFWNACLNPEIVIDFQKGDYFFRVSICQSDNIRWSAGYDYWFSNGGGCGGPSYVSSSDGYSSRKECIYDTLRKLSFNLERSIEAVLKETDDGPGNKNQRLMRLKNCRKEMDKYLDLYNPNQLLLFD